MFFSGLLGRQIDLHYDIHADSPRNVTPFYPKHAYTGSNYTGKWRPTPPDFKAGKDTQWGNVTPWIIDDIKQFRMAPPPALNSDTYRKSYTESKFDFYLSFCLDFRQEIRLTFITTNTHIYT